MSDPIRDALSGVMSNYVQARTQQRIGKASVAWQQLMRARDVLAGSAVVAAHRRITVRASAGQGSWARIPWIALLHGGVTDTTRAGVYVIYLFRFDMSAVYLTLNQGVTEPLQRLGQAVGLAWVRGQAVELRERVSELARDGFELVEPLDLHTDYATAQHYAASTIAHRCYARDSLPTDVEMLADAGRILDAYEGFANVAR